MKNYLMNISNVKIWALLRISLGWIFFWAFLDKLLGLGFTTCRQGGEVIRLCESAWIKGGSPVYGYLTHSSKGVFSSFYQSIASSDIVAWLFMLGLFLIGISLLLGIFVKLASSFGIVMMILLYTSSLLPAHNPIISEHIVYAIVLLGIMVNNAGREFGLGRWWEETGLVKKRPFLK